MKRGFTLFKRKGQKVWYFYFYEGHRRISKSTGKTKKYEADKYARAFMDKDIPENVTLKDFAEDFFIWDKCSWIKRKLARGKSFSRASAKNKRAYLENHIFPKYGHRFLDELNRVDIENWVISLDLAGVTKNHILYTFKAVLADAELRELIPINPLLRVEPMAANSKERDVFTLQELKILFPADIDEMVYIWKSLRWAACFLVFATTGARSGEVRALRWGNLLPEGGLIISQAVKRDGVIGETKTRETRVILIPQRTFNILTLWKAETPYGEKDDFIFFGYGRHKPFCGTYISDYLKPCLLRAGINIGDRYLVVHSFRHTYNTLMKKVLPMEVLQMLTGHRTERMTELYNHPSIEDRFKKLEPSRSLIEGVWEGE